MKQGFTKVNKRTNSQGTNHFLRRLVPYFLQLSPNSAKAVARIEMPGLVVDRDGVDTAAVQGSQRNAHGDGCMDRYRS